MFQKTLGPLSGTLTTTATAPLTNTGVLNKADLGTTCLRVIQGIGDGRRQYRVKLVGITASRNIAYATVASGATCAIKADADGSADEGSLIMGGSGASEWLAIADNLDLYVVASAASTQFQLTAFKA
jgi:hypothetical protein